jgi:sucrose-6-phosphate hydrolase SacC (GH32 family)
MTTHARYIKGALAYTDGHRKSLIDAIGTDVVKYIDDFVHMPVDDTTGDPTAWTATMVEAGASNTTVTSANIAGGAMLITTDTFDNDGANLQLNGEAFKLVSGNPLYFGARLKISDATESDFFIGLAITDTDILGGVTDRIGFEKLDAATDVKFMLEKNSTETLSASLLTAVADTYMKLEFFFDGTNVQVFVNNVEQTAPAITSLPDDEELRVSVQFLAGSAGAKTATVDYIRCIQFGRAA